MFIIFTAWYVAFAIWCVVSVLLGILVPAEDQKDVSALMMQSFVILSTLSAWDLSKIIVKEMIKEDADATTK